MTSDFSAELQIPPGITGTFFLPLASDGFEPNRWLSPSDFPHILDGMSKTVTRGAYYTFDRTTPHREVGDAIFEPRARMVLENGGDVYTLFKEDAYRLARAAWGARATLDGGHGPGYFSHYHPGGVHPVYIPGHPKAKNTPGHVFFGDRDEKWKTAARQPQ